MNDRQAPMDRVAVYRKRAFLAGGVALAISFVGWNVDREQFFRSWLVAFLYWVAISLGCIGILTIHFMAAGRWGWVIRRPAEAGARTVPLMALFFIPVGLGVSHLYEWSHVEHHDAILEARSPFLNVPFFLLRAAIYFALWIGASLWIGRMSKRQDEGDGVLDPPISRRLQVMSGPGMVLLGLTVSFAAVDWAMSTEAHWFSSIYGMLFLTGQLLAALAFCVAVTVILSKWEPLSRVMTPRRFRDLGNLMMAFVLLWAYMSFSQFLIIWSGNIPEEIHYYISRAATGWKWVALLLVVCHFAIPFVILLSRPAKQNPTVLLRVAVAVVILRVVDIAWTVSPAFHMDGPSFHWLDLTALVGIGGIWLGVFLGFLASRPLLAENDPRFVEYLGHE